MVMRVRKGGAGSLDEDNLGEGAEEPGGRSQGWQASTRVLLQIQYFNNDTEEATET